MYGDRRDFITGAVAMVLLSGCELVPTQAPSQGSAPPTGGPQTEQLAGSIQRSLSGTRM